MGTSSGLHQILKSLCLNSEWKYAVFWKLKHRARMVLTWEDAYYDNCEQHGSSETECFSETLDNSHGGNFSHDPLGLSVAKMSYHVYSLGEGIVGQVAVSGKHCWIFADKHIDNSFLSFESCDGWQSQFAAGIRTIVVVAVVPHGVLQLGSLNEVVEDLKLVSRIRDLFFALQGSSVGHIASPVGCSMKSSLSQPDFHARNLASEALPPDNTINEEGPIDVMPEFSYSRHNSDGNLYPFPISDGHSRRNYEVINKQDGLELSTTGSEKTTKLLTTRSAIPDMEHQNHVGINGKLAEGDSSGLKNMSWVTKQNVCTNDSLVDSINLFNITRQAEELSVDHEYFPSNVLGSALSDEAKSDGIYLHRSGMLNVPESSDNKLQRNLGKPENSNILDQLDSMKTSQNLFAGCELYEVLGPAFLGRNVDTDWQADNTEAGVEIPEGMSSSQVTFESGSENLLEAVVANVCHSGSDIRSERSFYRQAHSLLTAENTPEPSSQTKHSISSAGYSISQPSYLEGSMQHSFSSAELCGALPSKDFSSTCASACSEQLGKSSSEPAKNNKKRARPGENSRPRPRDRQLIQDRIKELRELVPNGAKCSIDSLLERTIKHMLFLQSITTHADKLSKCAESKIRGAGMLGSSNYEQGSSWAVEVGGHLKVCSIIVENLNKNGQMLVEMLCEECSHFLEIADAIRSLGLTILKGITEAHEDKIWICFVVEGQNNRIMHRMDVLWSLVQVLQPKTTS